MKIIFGLMDLSLMANKDVFGFFVLGTIFGFFIGATKHFDNIFYALFVFSIFLFLSILAIKLDNTITENSFIKEDTIEKLTNKKSILEKLQDNFDVDDKRFRL